IDDVISAIRNYKTHPSIVNPELFSAWYGDNDGMAAKRIADLCTQCVKREIGQPTERKVYRTTIAFHRNWARRVLQRGLRNKGFLGYVGHGRKRKGNFWIPKIMVESVTNGGDVSSYLEFLR